MYLTLINDTNLGAWWGRLSLSLVQGSVVEAAGSVQWAAVVTCRWGVSAERDAAVAPGDVVEK